MAPYESDDNGEPLPVEMQLDRLSEPAGASPLEAVAAKGTGLKGAADDGARFLRGTLTHALLQYLPVLEPALWSKAAAAFVAARGTGLPSKVQKSICSETLGILTDPRFAALFGPMSRAEVPIVAQIERPRGQAGPPLRLTGQIDRLAVVGDEVLIIDYKTNRRPPAGVDDVAEVYLYQLAAYRLALSMIFKGKTIKAMLLWTDGGKILEIPEPVLDRFASQLWQLDASRLDA